MLAKLEKREFGLEDCIIGIELGWIACITESQDKLAISLDRDKTRHTTAVRNIERRRYVQSFHWILNGRSRYPYTSRASIIKERKYSEIRNRLLNQP